jgi:hypothetical protein
MSCRAIVRGIERVRASTTRATSPGSEAISRRWSVERTDRHAPRPSADIAATEAETNSRRETAADLLGS